MKTFRRLAILTLLLLIPAYAEAANKIWLTTADGNWGTTGNWSGGTPTTGDNVYIPAGTPSITAGLDQHTVALGSVYFQSGYTGTVGTSTAYLQIKTTGLIYAGSGLAYIDMGSENVTANIQATAVGTTARAGLYLLDSNLATLAVSGGSVALAGQAGETSTVATVRVIGTGSNVTLGTGVTATTANISNGTLTANCALTTANVSGGTFVTGYSGAITTINASTGGKCQLGSSGTISTLNLLGGQADMTVSGLPRTISSLKINPGSQFTYDPAVITISAFAAPDYPSRLSSASP